MRTTSITRFIATATVGIFLSLGLAGPASIASAAPAHSAHAGRKKSTKRPAQQATTSGRAKKTKPPAAPAPAPTGEL